MRRSLTGSTRLAVLVFVGAGASSGGAQAVGMSDRVSVGSFTGELSSDFSPARSRAFRQSSFEITDGSGGNGNGSDAGAGGNAIGGRAPPGTYRIPFDAGFVGLIGCPWPPGDLVSATSEPFQPQIAGTIGSDASPHSL
jgi:hypothetical protein